MAYVVYTLAYCHEQVFNVEKRKEERKGRKKHLAQSVATAFAYEAYKEMTLLRCYDIIMEFNKFTIQLPSDCDALSTLIVLDRACHDKVVDRG